MVLIACAKAWSLQGIHEGVGLAVLAAGFAGGADLFQLKGH